MTRRARIVYGWECWLSWRFRYLDYISQVDATCWHAGLA